MTNPQHEALVEAQAAALVALTYHGISPDVQELLVNGDGRGTVAPGALGKVVQTVAAALSATAATPSDEEARLRSAHDQLEKTAREYATHYMQDEADSEDDCVCGQEQHLRAVAVFDALGDVARARAALEPQAKDV